MVGKKLSQYIGAGMGGYLANRRSNRLRYGIKRPCVCLPGGIF